MILAEAGLQIHGQPGLHSKALLKKKKVEKAKLIFLQ